MHFKPKKKLGQNFLTEPRIRKKIVDACSFLDSDVVLEIGSGKGELTALISPLVRKIYAVEIDRLLFRLLKDEFKNSANVEVVNADILKLDFRKLLRDNHIKIKVIGNIPYYISTPIIERLIKFRANINVAYITMQKEFAERMTAYPGTKTYGALSCFAQYHFEAKKLFIVKKTCFFPRPKVDSTFLRLETRRVFPVKIKDELRLFKIIRTAFNQRRKTLKNSLRQIVPAPCLEAFFSSYNIKRDIRPERLSLTDFVNLSNI